MQIKCKGCFDYFYSTKAKSKLRRSREARNKSKNVKTTPQKLNHIRTQYTGKNRPSSSTRLTSRSKNSQGEETHMAVVQK